MKLYISWIYRFYPLRARFIRIFPVVHFARFKSHNYTREQLKTAQSNNLELERELHQLQGIIGNQTPVFQVPYYSLKTVCHSIKS